MIVHCVTKGMVLEDKPICQDDLEWCWFCGTLSSEVELGEDDNGIIKQLEKARNLYTEKQVGEFVISLLQSHHKKRVRRCSTRRS